MMSGDLVWAIKNGDLEKVKEFVETKVSTPVQKMECHLWGELGCQTMKSKRGMRLCKIKKGNLAMKLESLLPNLSNDSISNPAPNIPNVSSSSRAQT